MIKGRCLQVTLAVAVAALFAGSSLAQERGRTAAEGIILSYPSKSLTAFLIPEVARQEGFFQREGLGAKLIYMRGGLDIKALLTGDLDYAVAGGSAISAFVAGAAVRLVMGYVISVEHVLLAQPKYQTVKDLKGQVVASLNPGGLVDVLAKQILIKNGLNPDRDVVLINIGGTAERYAALKSGSVAATLLGIPHSFRAEKEGYRRVAAAADYVDVPTTGLVVRNDRIGRQPQQIKRTVRASLRAMAYIREHRPETIQIVMRELGMDQDSASKGYDQLLQIMSRDGTYRLAGVQFFIDLARQAQKVQREISTSQIIESTLLQEVLRELGGVR